MPFPPELIEADEIELAQRLAAAYFSHVMGLKSIDRVLKHYVGGTKPSEDWLDLARHAQFIGKAGRAPVLTRKQQ
jgi:hypothetical protein